jgi:hypothetical protein
MREGKMARTRPQENIDHAHLPLYWDIDDIFRLFQFHLKPLQHDEIGKMRDDLFEVVEQPIQNPGNNKAKTIIERGGSPKLSKSAYGIVLRTKSALLKSNFKKPLNLMKYSASMTLPETLDELDLIKDKKNPGCYFLAPAIEMHLAIYDFKLNKFAKDHCKAEDIIF